MEKICPFCAEPINSEAKKCKHCGEWLVNDTPDESVPINTLSSEESWDLKGKLKTLCEYAIWVLIIITAQDLLSEYGGHIRSGRYAWIDDIHPSIAIIIGGLLDVWIYATFKKYFSSLNSLMTQFIVLNLLMLPFNAFSDEVSGNDGLLVVGFLLAIVLIVYHIIIGMKIRKMYKENSYLGTLFLLDPIILIVYAIFEENAYGVASCIDAVYWIMLYSAIGNSIKMENPLNSEEDE